MNNFFRKASMLLMSVLVSTVFSFNVNYAVEPGGVSEVNAIRNGSGEEKDLSTVTAEEKSSNGTEATSGEKTEAGEVNQEDSKEEAKSESKDKISEGSSKKAEKPVEDKKAQTSVKLSKTERGKQGELKGATIKLVKGKDSSGEEVATWISGDSPMQFDLAPGVYTMVEVEAPNGFVKTKPITFEIKDSADPEYKNIYIGYSDQKEYKSERFLKSLYIKQYDGEESEAEEKGTVVYCFNVMKMLPSDKNLSGEELYTKEYGSEELFLEKAEKPFVNEEGLKQSVLNVIYNGYPNDASGIREKYGLSEGEFRRATQNAIYFYTDSIRPGRYEGSLKEEQAYKELVGKSLLESPANMILNIYTPADKRYQNLLGTRFIEPKTINMENERKEGYEEPKEEPKEDEKDKPKEGEKDKPKEDEKDKPKEDEKDKPKEDEKDKPKEDEKDKPKEDEKDKPKEDEKDKPKEDEKDKPKEDEKDKPKEDEKDEPKEDEKDKPSRSTSGGGGGSSSRRSRREEPKEEKNEERESGEEKEEPKEELKEEPKEDTEVEKNEAREAGEEKEEEKTTIIKDDKKSENKPVEEKKYTLPVTGDGLNFELYLYVGLALGGALLLVSRKKKMNKNEK